MKEKIPDSTLELNSWARITVYLKASKHTAQWTRAQKNGFVRMNVNIYFFVRMNVNIYFFVRMNVNIYHLSKIILCKNPLKAEYL